MVELILAGAEAGFDIAETLSISQLAKGHTEELIPAGKGFNLIASAIALDMAAKKLRVNKVHELGERVFFGKHSDRLARTMLGEKSGNPRIRFRSLTSPDTKGKPANIGSP